MLDNVINKSASKEEKAAQNKERHRLKVEQDKMLIIDAIDRKTSQFSDYKQR